jgi:hypothetical protein
MIRRRRGTLAIAVVKPFSGFAMAGVRGATAVRPRGDGCHRHRLEQNPRDRHGGEHDQNGADGGMAGSNEPGCELPDPCLQVTSAKIVGLSSVRLVIEM